MGARVDLLNWTMQKKKIWSIEKDQGTTLCHEEARVVEKDLRSSIDCQSNLSHDDSSPHCCQMGSSECSLLFDDGGHGQD